MAVIGIVGNEDAEAEFNHNALDYVTELNASLEELYELSQSIAMDAERLEDLLDGKFSGIDADMHDSLVSQRLIDSLRKLITEYEGEK